MHLKHLSLNGFFNRAVFRLIAILLFCLFCIIYLSSITSFKGISGLFSGEALPSAGRKTYLPVVFQQVPSSPTKTPTIPTSKTATPTPVRTLTLTPTKIQNGNYVYPLKTSANHRYLVDQNNTPFFISGDSPHGLFGDLSLADAEIYLAGARANGINAIWVQLLCSDYSSICPGYTTYDGITPFSWNGSNPTTMDLASPNSNYFSRMDAMINLAAKYNIVVFLDPIETGGWLQVLLNNGATKDFNYGVYLGNRYKNFSNIVWIHGNDFQTWRDSTDDAVVQAVANGIKSVENNHLQTVELDFFVSDSLNDPTWAPIIGLDAVYTYYPTYDQVLKGYNRNSLPVVMVEGYYEFQSYCCDGYSGPHELRVQDYWTALSGAAGQFYGNADLYTFPSDWKSSGWNSTTGITEFKIMNSFFGTIPWYNLVPDQNHAVVTLGYGSYATTGYGNTSNYLTAAMTADGKLAIAYMPTKRPITVNMAKLSGAVTARWFDPTNGSYINISGSPFSNTGPRQFTPPGTNSSGEGDWVLVLAAN